MRLLLVGDDRNLIETLKNKLIKQQYAVDIANDSDAYNELLATFDYDLVLLDSMLPAADSAKLCQDIRSAGHCIPLLILSSNNDSSAKIAGLNAGADDYLVKPFDFEELLARIHALLRRERQSLPPILVWGDLQLDPNTHEASYARQSLHLTPKEFALLEQFMRHSELVFSLDKIISSLWAFEEPPSEYAVRTHIKGLRQKLSAARAPKDLIETVYGIGYRLKPLPKPTDLMTQLPTPTSDGVQPPLCDRRLAALWSEFKSEVIEHRLKTLELLVRELARGPVSPHKLAEATVDAHKLAESLDSFGFDESSNLARDIELLLNDKTLPECHQRLATLLTGLCHDLKLSPPRLDRPLEQSHDDGLLLLIVADNPAFSQQLSIQAKHLGMRTAIASSVAQVQKTIAKDMPTVAVVHVLSDSCETDRCGAIAGLTRMAPNIPLIVLAEGSQVKNRSDITRRGGTLVLPFPTTPHQVMKAITSSIQAQGVGAKVMVVDSDQQFLDDLHVNLASWGFNLLVIDDNPEIVWDSFLDFKPDLLVLEADMPNVNGLQLCQTLRSDVRWQHLPIIVLNSPTDNGVQPQLRQVGVNDVVCKPMSPQQLALRILNRLEQASIAVTKPRVA